MDNGRGNGEISGREGGRDSGRDFSERDFSLVPRALQVEEDLVRIVDDYRSLVYAGSLM